MVDVAPVLPEPPNPDPAAPNGPAPNLDDLGALGEAVAEEFLATRKEIQAVRDLIQPAAEPLAPIVNVQSAVPAITVSPADNPAPIVNVETAAPVINVLPAPPALPPTFNFHADSAAVGFDIQTVVDELSLMTRAITEGNNAVRTIQHGMVALAQAMDRQAAAIEAQGNAIDAMARALLAPRKIITGPDGKPSGVEIG